MFYPNLLNLREGSFQKLDFSTFSAGINSDVDESILPIKYGVISYNYDFNDGALKDGIGISTPMIRYSKVDSDYRKTLNLPYGYSVYGAWIFNAWHDVGNLLFPLLVVYCGDGKMYYNYLHSEQTEMHEMTGLSFTEIPNVITYNLNGVDTLILVNDVDGMYTWTETSGGVKIDNAPKVSSMSLHYERLFATTHDNTRRVWFSDDLNPTNFNVSSSEGGYIDLIDDCGRSNKVVSFNGYVYVIRDYNIARISAYAEQEDFSVVQLDVGNCKIFADTVCICDNKLFYLASDGLRSFNGSLSHKVNLGIDKFFNGIDNKYAKAGYSDGFYYLACKMNFDDDIIGCESFERMHNNALIKLNVSTGEFSILRGYDVREICVINDTLGSTVLCVVYDGLATNLGMLDMSGKVFDIPTYKFWKSPNTDLGYPNNYKLISEIHINNVNNCSIVVTADDKRKVYRVKGKKKVNVVRPYLKGKKISIGFISDVDGVKIESPQIKVGIL